MKYGNFFRLLTFKEKMVFTSGAMIERAGFKAGFNRLRLFRNLVSGAEALTFDYSMNDGILTLEKAGQKIQLRKKSSDYEVFRQVFLRDEYLPVISYLIDNNIEVRNVIDAGSNIGLTTVKLATQFPQARFICIEPDPSNFQQLSTNLSNNAINATPLQNALWYKEDDLYIDFGFRDGKDWSRGVKDTNTNSGIKVRSVTLPKLIQQFDLPSIDLLKIDIEGSEASLFKEENDLSFLDKVKVLVIEIHDEFNCRENIYRILRARNFTLFNAEELTLAVRTK